MEQSRTHFLPIQGVMVLDGLNTAVLNDERNGIVAPVTAAQ